jgi:hypothetical protein
MISLRNATHETIRLLLTEEHDWNALNEDLINFGRERGERRGTEQHHIEPYRVEIVHLYPLEHLASHICTSKLNPTDTNHAKVGAFVHYFPGSSYRRIVELPDEVFKLVLKYGQTRPSKDAEEMRRISNLPQSKEAQRATGKKVGARNGKASAEKTRQKLLGREILWGEKISSAILARGEYTCERCGKLMKNIPSNILQHQRSTKCR